MPVSQFLLFSVVKNNTRNEYNDLSVLIIFLFEG